MNSVNIDIWLGVLPQLIARIDHPGIPARKLLHALLVRLGEKHAQALVYPLAVALKSPREDRKLAAEGLMKSLKEHSKILIEQALLVSHELIRVAILWTEFFHEALEDASRMYFGEGNVQGSEVYFWMKVFYFIFFGCLGMLDILIPVHLMINQGPMTQRESSFIHTYGPELNEAVSLIFDINCISSSFSGNVSTITCTQCTPKIFQFQ
jgi:FKBP12-rapamycin complex-associated protein